MRLIDADELNGKAFADPDDGEYFVYCQDIDEAPIVGAGTVSTSILMLTDIFALNPGFTPTRMIIAAEASA